MLKFIRAKGAQPSAERIKIQKDLFQCQQTVQHGFPNKPVALAWDPILRLMAIATKSGAVKILGKPGVEFCGHHASSEATVLRMLFVPGQGRLISVCDDNSIHLWEVNGHNLEPVQTFELEKKIKKISACTVNAAGNTLYFGTEGGNVYQLDLTTFQISDKVIYLDTVLQRIKDIYQKNPGAVECILEVPDDSSKLVMGYNKGLLVQWNRDKESTERVWSVNQQLESVAWKKAGEELISSHNDGSYVQWYVKRTGDDQLENKITTPYGPFPCKAITKIFVADGEKDDWIVFAGGMPRANYGDHNTVSVIHGEDRHVCFDFTSKVIDFFTVASESGKDLDAVVILAEEELVVIDLTSEGWPVFQAPYLAPLHSSAVTAQLVTNVTQELYQKLLAAGEKQASGKYSTKAWPINGGETGEIDMPPTPMILLTGHEDGSVHIWDVSGPALKHVLKYSTAPLFTGDDFEAGDAPNEEGEEDWPPFRKVGVFDPYSDDPRLAVKKLAFCSTTGLVVIGGTAGQIVTIQLEEEDKNDPVKTLTLNIVSDRDSFVWKGHSKLDTRAESIKQPFGYKASSVVQLHPPAAVTCLALHSDWRLVAIGTAHGLGLVDIVQLKGVVSKCTLTATDIAAGDHPMSRRKSFKKSLRESFRRLRKGRSQMNAERKGPAEKGAGSQSPASPLPAETRPIERQVEARATDDSMASMVRCLYLSSTYIINAETTTPTLWAGTNSGAVFIFTLSVPQGEKRSQTAVTGQLAKEIQLRHRAPVISMGIVDGAYAPLAEKSEVDAGLVAAPELPTPHRLVICSEEQFKIFTLPNLRPFGKFKLTALEGARVRKTAILRFSSVDGKHAENSLVCLTNLGEISVFSLPDLRRLINVNCIRREDIYGISSLVFARNGEAFYMHSSSEIQRIALAAKDYLRLRCRLDLPEGVRGRPMTPEKREVAVTVVETKVEASPVKEEPPSTESPGNRLTNGVLEETKSSIPEGDFSIGDITIDSIRDHLTANLDETKSSLESRMERMSVTVSSSSSHRVVETVQVIKTKTNASGETVVSTETVTMETNESSAN